MGTLRRNIARQEVKTQGGGNGIFDSLMPSCSEGVGRGDDSKMPCGIFTTSDAHVEMIQEGPVFFFRCSFLRGSLNLNRLPIVYSHL